VTRILSYALAAILAASPVLAATPANKDAGSAKGAAVAQATPPKDAKAKQAPAGKADEKAKKVEGQKTETQTKR